jgi:hypothetical protein
MIQAFFFVIKVISTIVGIPLCLVLAIGISNNLDDPIALVHASLLIFTTLLIVCIKRLVKSLITKKTDLMAGSQY